MSDQVTIARSSAGHWRLECRLIVPRPIDEVFPFFADAHNLEAITPDLVRFRVLTPAPIVMRPGTTIDYALRIKSVPVRWRTAIPVWDPPRRFVDEQIKGPYALWRHEHTFEPVDNGVSTLVRDRVDYRPRGGPLAPLLHALFIERDLRAIFEHRSRVLAERFAAPPAPAGAPR